MPDWLSRLLELFPEWVAAIGTAGAFVIAAQAYRTSVRDAHAKQARLVQAYLDGLVDWHDYDVSGPGTINPTTTPRPTFSKER